MKDLKLGTRTGPLLAPPPGDKTFFRRERMFQEYDIERYSNETPWGSPEGCSLRGIKVLWLLIGVLGF